MRNTRLLDRIFVGLVLLLAAIFVFLGGRWVVESVRSRRADHAAEVRRATEVCHGAQLPTCIPQTVWFDRDRWRCRCNLRVTGGDVSWPPR